MMSDSDSPIQPITSATVDQFPILKPVQIERVALHGSPRLVQRGEVLLEPGDKNTPFFIVKSGQLEIVQPSGEGEKLLALCGPGQFTGESGVLYGRRILVRVRARESGELIQIDREHLMGLVQRDTELSDIFMRAFMLRHTELVAQGLGDVVIYGSSQLEFHSLDLAQSHWTPLSA